ncbi:MAG: S-adenosyl-l-methionine hydroxide adenosyltransferase family protein [Vulcanimicrobiota bacterium]
MILVHVIADYGPGDLAFSEMLSALAAHLPAEARWITTPVESFNTLATGFVVAQLGLKTPDLQPEKTVLYANCAPRRDRREARPDNEGEGLLFGRLSNGVGLLAVNSGYSLSFVRDELRELWSVNCPRAGSQFRSRDLFPPLVGQLARGDLGFLRDPLEPQQVLVPYPTDRIGYIDSFGNLKTTMREGDPQVDQLVPGSRVSLRINGIERTATVATGSFQVREGDMALAPGSSGHQRRFWEVFARGGSAHHAFGRPRVGAPIELAL